jgi:hypothetical protein
MAATVTNRNFTGGGNNSQTKKKRSSSLLGVFIFTLIFLAVILLFSAIYLSRQLDLNHNPQQQHHRNDGGSVTAVSVVSTNNIKRGSNGGNNDIRNKQSITSTVQQEPPASPLLPHNNSNNSNKMIPKYQTSFRNFSSFKTYPHDRLYCMIPFIWNPKIYSAIMNTWGQRCDTIHFLTDAMVGGEINGDHISFEEDSSASTRPYWEFPDGTFPPNVKFINMTRSWEDCPSTTNRRTGKLEKKVCRHIWEKMWRSWIYVDQHHIHDAEWFCKVDYDTFFFPDNLRYYVHDVKQWNGINEYHYFGHVIQHRSRKDRPMVVGASACWSRKTLHDIAEVYRNMPKGSTKGERGKCEDRAHATEEVTTSQCLKDHLNIDPEPARDEYQREYITIDKYPLVLGWNRTEQGEWWYWRGKPANAGQTENTIARRPIGIHKYKSADEILRLWEEFYGPSEDDVGGNDALEKVGQDRRHGKVSKKFVLEVRKAMGIDP